VFHRLLGRPASARPAQAAKGFLESGRCAAGVDPHEARSGELVAIGWPSFFSAVGFPWTILRFARRVCYDGWTESRLPEIVRDVPPPGRPWRYVDRAWTRG
jgi:hypothetical protein